LPDTEAAEEPGVDYSKEPTTLIVFEFHEATDGILLTISESGFDQIPLARRAAAFKANDGGWAMQASLIAKYLALQAVARVAHDRVRGFPQPLARRPLH
jgi:hypothetical protein